MNDQPIYLTVSPDQAGQPLVALVVEAIGGDTNAAQNLIRRGGLWLEKTRLADGNHPAPEGALVSIKRPAGGVYDDVILDPTWIIYEDDDVIALNKPAGLYVDVTPWDIEANLRVAMDRFLAGRDGAVPPVHLAHRLDRDTSGVLLFSKNRDPVVNRALHNAFLRSQTNKRYLALCSGLPAEDYFDVQTGHGRSAFGIFRVYPPEHIGQMLLNGSVVKGMHTRFEVLRRTDDAALLAATPITGRTHQIRLHAAHLGLPLLGDARYGGPTEWRGQTLSGHLLHAERLELPHPRGNRTLALYAPAPPWIEVTS